MRIKFDLKKKSPACCIFGAGDFHGLMTSPSGKDLIIAADGGLRYIKKLSLKPDLILGDFDSGRESEAREFLSENFEGEDSRKRLVRLSPIKDRSDLSEALCEGKKRGYGTFYIYGCTGKRPDHTFAALQELAGLSREGREAYLFFDGYAATAVTDGRIEFPESMEGFISVFSYGDVSEGVMESGLKYTVADHRLTNDFSMGLSNEFTGLPAVVGVEKGTLLIMFELKQSGVNEGARKRMKA